MRKKAVSPVVSTVLLVLIVIVLAAVIFLWSQGFVKEALTKEIAGKSKKVDYFCSDVKVLPVINENDGGVGVSSFGFTNTGNVPIYSISLQVSPVGQGKKQILDIDKDEGGLVNPGMTETFSDGYPNPLILLNYNDYEEVVAIPVILGETKDGGIEAYKCSERYGITI